MVAENHYATSHAVHFAAQVLHLQMLTEHRFHFLETKKEDYSGTDAVNCNVQIVSHAPSYRTLVYTATDDITMKIMRLYMADIHFWSG